MERTAARRFDEDSCFFRLLDSQLLHGSCDDKPTKPKKRMRKRDLQDRQELHHEEAYCAAAILPLCLLTQLCFKQPTSWDWPAQAP